MKTRYQTNAAFLHGIRKIRTGSFDAGPPEAGDVLVRVRAAGICGSDLHVFETGDFVPAFPVVPGHEVSGTVVEVGASVADLSPEMPVVLDSRVPCRACDMCAAGMFQRCRKIGFLGEVRPGGFAGLLRVPREMVFPIPPELPLDLAVLAEPVAVGVHAIRRALAIAPATRTALVLGGGPIGFVLAALLRVRGVDAVVVEPNRWRRERVGTIGVETAAGLDELGGRVFDSAFTAAGFRGAVERALACVSPGGCVAAVALHRQHEQLPINDVIAREIALIGCHVFADEMPDAIHALVANPDLFRPMLSAEIGLGEVEGAYQALLGGSAELLKVVVDPSKGS